MAILPTRTLEIEFDVGVWTNISADVVEISTRRGRNKESGAFETGQLLFTVRNDTRKYDPDYAAGTYYGKLRPNRRVRFKATYNAVTYPVFQGYIDRITQVYGGPNDATAQFQVSDLFKILNRVELPMSVYDAVVAADAPAAWWPLSEPVGSTTVDDVSGNGYTLDVTGAPELGQASLIVREPRTAVLTTSSVGQSIGRWYSGRLPATGPPMSVETWFKRTVDGADGGMGGIMCDPLSHGMFAILTSATVVAVQAVNGANSQQLAVTTGVNFDDNATHHVVATWAASGAIKIYVDGVDRTAGSTTCANVPFLDNSAFVFANGYFSDVDTGIQQMVAIYNVELSPAQIAAHNSAGRTPWNDDLPGQRLGRILDLAEIAAPERDVDTGTTSLQSTDLGGNALAYAQKIEETELGWLFVTASGLVRFFGYEQGQTDYLTSLATLVDDDSGAGLPYRHVSSDVDEARIVTRATVSRQGSVAVTWDDAAAIDEFQIIDEVHEGLLHDDDTVSLSYAQWIVNAHKAPSSRVGTITLELAKDPATMYPGILVLELADRVTYKRKPQNTGAVISVDMRVEAITHATGAHYWRTDLLLSPFNLTGGGAGFPVVIWGTTTWDNHAWGHGDAV